MRTLTVDDPYSGKTTCTVELADEASVDATLERSRNAARVARRSALGDRMALCEKATAAMEARCDDIAAGHPPCRSVLAPRSSTGIGSGSWPSCQGAPVRTAPGAGIGRDVDDDGRLLWIPATKTPAGRRTVEVPEVLRPHLVRLHDRVGQLGRLWPRKRPWVLDQASTFSG
jgi:hypothetical protein